MAESTSNRNTAGEENHKRKQVKVPVFVLQVGSRLRPGYKKKLMWRIVRIAKPEEKKETIMAPRTLGRRPSKSLHEIQKKERGNVL